MANKERGTSKFLLCVVLYVVAVSFGNCMPPALLGSSLRQSKITSQNNGRLLIGHNITREQTKATRNPGPSDVDYQADMDPFNAGSWDQQPQVKGQVEGFPKQDGATLNKLLGMEPKVECTGDSMKLQVLDVAPTSGSLFFVDRGSHLSPLPLSNLPASCGYNIHSTQRETVLVAPYDGCFVTLEENNYVLPLRWWGLPVKMSCPLMRQGSTSPPMVTCHPEGMVVRTEWKLSDEIKIKLNGNWEPLSSASPRCIFSVVEHPEGLVITLRYATCFESKGGMYVVELFRDGESRISCTSLSHAPPHPTKSPTFYPEGPEEREEGPTPYVPQIPVQPATSQEWQPFVPPRPWSFRPKIPEVELPEVLPTTQPFYTQVQEPTRQNPSYIYEKPEDPEVLPATQPFYPQVHQPSRQNPSYVYEKPEDPEVLPTTQPFFPQVQEPTRQNPFYVYEKPEDPEVLPTTQPFYPQVQQPTRQNPFYISEIPEYIPTENPPQPSSPPDPESQYFQHVYPGNEPNRHVGHHIPYPKFEETIEEHPFNPLPDTPGIPHPENTFLPDNKKPPIPVNPTPEVSQENSYHPYYPFDPHFFPPASNRKPIDPVVTPSPNVQSPTIVPTQPGILHPFDEVYPLNPFPHPIVPTDQTPVEPPGPTHPFHSSEQENTEFQFGFYPEYHSPVSENEQFTDPTVVPPTLHPEVTQPIYPYPFDNSKVPEKLHPQWPIKEPTTPKGPPLIYPSPGPETEDVDIYEVPSNPPFIPSPNTPAPYPNHYPEQPQWHQPESVPTQVPQQPNNEQHPESLIPLLPGGFQYNMPSQRPGNCPELCSVGISYCCPQITFHQHFHHVVPAAVAGKEDLSLYSGVPFLPSLASYGIDNVLGKLYPSKNSQELPRTDGSTASVSWGNQEFISLENIHEPNLQQYEMQPNLPPSQSWRSHTLPGTPVAEEYEATQNHQIGQLSPEMIHHSEPKVDFNSNQHSLPQMPGELQRPFKPSRLGTPKSDGQLLVPYHMLQNTEAFADETQHPDMPQQVTSSARVSETEGIGKQDLEPKRYTLLKRGPPGQHSRSFTESSQPVRYLFTGNQEVRNRHLRNLIPKKRPNSSWDYLHHSENQQTGFNNSSDESISRAASDASKKFRPTRLKSRIFQSWRTPQNPTASKDSDPSNIHVQTSQNISVAAEHLNQGPDQQGEEIRKI